MSSSPTALLPARWKKGELSIWLTVTMLLAVCSVSFVDRPLADWVQLNISDHQKGLIWLLGRPGRFEYWLIVVFLLLGSGRISRALTGQISRNSLRQIYAASYLVLSVVISTIFAQILKFLVNRPRPTAAPDSNGWQIGHFTFNDSLHSLPSGHTQTAWAAAFAVWAYFPKLRIPLLLLAISTMISRVLMNRHYLSDTLISVGLSAAGAYLAIPVLIRFSNTESFNRFYRWLIPESAESGAPVGDL